MNKVQMLIDYRVLALKDAVVEVSDEEAIRLVALGAAKRLAETSESAPKSAKTKKTASK